MLCGGGNRCYPSVEPERGGLIRSFYLVSSHGAVLFYVAAHPQCTIAEIADELALTHRTVWGLIGDLRRAGMLHVHKDGRRHRYEVNLDAPFLHPSMQGYTLRSVLSVIAPQDREVALSGSPA